MAPGIVALMWLYIADRQDDDCAVEHHDDVHVQG